MLAVPLVLDLVVVALAAYLVRSRGSHSGARGAAGGTACAVALLAPMSAVALGTPQWVRATTVMMMVLGFYALAEVAGTPTADRTPSTRAAGDGEIAWGEPGRPPAGAAEQARTWAQFERQFAAYVESRAGGERGSTGGGPSRTGGDGTTA